MNAVESTEVLRPGASGIRRRLSAAVMAALPFGFWVLRRVWPIARFGSTTVVTRYDDVCEVLSDDRAFAVPYRDHLDIITDGELFFLGMGDTPTYRAGLAAMQRVVLHADLPALGERAEAEAEALVAEADGRLNVVGDLVRPVSFRVLSHYFGVPEPTAGRLDVWSTRLFEFQFAASPKDHDLRRQALEIAPAFRAHLDMEIARRKAGGLSGDDVIARCLARQAAGELGYSDTEIRTAMLCMVVGGPPQPPMVVPQALEQLLRRPDALASAVAAAHADDDDRLWRIVREAMRFDPLAPGLPRIALPGAAVAVGTRRSRSIPEGSTVIAAFASAMMDERRLPHPSRFDPDRREHEYIHFGHGLHECFGRQINRAILHRMIKPLLRRANLRRAPGRDGHLTKNGPFAQHLVVAFD